MQLAQLNIAAARYDTADDRMAGFTGRVDAVNAMVDRTDGFVLRLTDDDATDGALSLRMEGEGDFTLVNISVWRDIDSLFHFVYKTVHTKVMQGKRQWFTPMAAAHQVLWWIPDGHIPTLDEAREKLDLIRRNGPGPKAFDFTVPFDENGTAVQPNFPRKDCA